MSERLRPAPKDRARAIATLVSTAMITCYIRYTLDPHRLEDFEEYARRWPPIIARCGGTLLGYFLPKEGANNVALALIEFETLAAYEAYRGRLAADPEARENRAHAERTRCILVEDRSFLRRA
jgi:uncharacterized protein (DUF1330 family)